MIEGCLEYYEINERYGVFRNDWWEFEDFHCGDPMEVLVEGKWVESRIEKAWDKEGGHWYLVDTPFRGNLENVKVRYDV